MLKAWKLLAAAFALCATSAAHAIVQDTDGCSGTNLANCETTATAVPIGPLLVFGTFNTRPSILVVDTTASKLCDFRQSSLQNCRVAYGLDALKRGREFSVGQVLRWDRSGAFAINATEIIACFAYYDSPGGAYFSCQSQARNGMDGYVLDQSATALGWRAYTGAGLTPQSATRVNALYAKRQRVTAYTIAYGVFPPDRMHALDTDETTTTTTNDPPAPESVVEFELVTVTGSKERPPVTSVPPATTVVPAVVLTPVTTDPNRSPEVIVNPCVSFAACSGPPPTPPTSPPPKVCTKECNDQLAIMKETCNETSKDLGFAFGLGSAAAGIVAGVIADPLVGYATFRWTAFAGGVSTGVWAAACTKMNNWYANTCLAKAQQNGC